MEKDKLKAEDCVDFYIRAAWFDVSRLYNELAVAHGLTMSMGFILLNINRQGGSNPTKLGPQMGMQANSLSRSLRTLEEMGLIYRERATKDKRQVRVFLTEEGEAKRAFARDVVYQFNTALRERIDPEALDTFFKVVQEVHQLIPDMRDKFIHAPSNEKE